MLPKPAPKAVRESAARERLAADCDQASQELAASWETSPQFIVLQVSWGLAK